MLRRTLLTTTGLGLLVSPLLITEQALSQVAPTVTLSASPTSIPLSESSTLAWTSTHATSCSGTGKGFSPSGASGSLAVSPKATATYDITCTGAGGSASQSAKVTVTAAPTLAMGMIVATTGTSYVYSSSSKSRPQSATRRRETKARSWAVPRATDQHGGRWSSTMTLPGGLTRAVSRPYRRRRRRS